MYAGRQRSGDENFYGFLGHWCTGLVRGLEGLDAVSRSKVLASCGRGCAESYTAAVFREAGQESRDLDEFLQRLTARFPDAVYEPVSLCSVRVRYGRCGCDLVKRGLTASPLLCDCSAFNLEENFEVALGSTVRVSGERSILRGDTQCSFLVSWRAERNRFATDSPREEKPFTDAEDCTGSKKG